MNGFVIVANRLPVEIGIDGQLSTSPGGLSSAMASVAEEGTHWVGWGGAHAGRRPAFEHDGLHLHPVALSPIEVERYYAGFSNGVLWPLFHGRLRTVDLDRTWWRAYRLVNERFAAASAEIAPLGATVWIHDYHLLLAPAMIRARRPDLRIGFFLHIPFPNAQLFSILPWRREVINGMLGADLLGFQVEEDVTNFITTAERVIGTRATGAAALERLRSITIDAFPISVDFDQWNAAGDRAQAEADRIRAELGVGHVFLGIDRLDYTKGIVQRLQAFGELLDEGSVCNDASTFVQVAVPSRSNVPAYQDERADVEALVTAINGRHVRPDGSLPIMHIETSLDEAGMAAWYRAADTLVVTSLADGMNLVAKEFVAARSDLGGALVLSEFAGAAADLDGALIVNPYDIEAIKRAMVASIDMAPAARAARLQSMRGTVRRNDVHRWAQTFLARVRSIHRARVHEQAPRALQVVVDKPAAVGDGL